MTDITWGDPIPVDGKRPDWLRDELPQILSGDNVWLDSYGKNSYWSWRYIDAIRLPADHPYYTVQRHNAQNGTNFTYWPGGENAPDDWDGGKVLRRGGGFYRPERWVAPYEHNQRWSHSSPFSFADIIGYARRAEPLPATDGPAHWARSRVTDLVLDEGPEALSVRQVRQAFARYIEQHEQPPVDPDVLAVREILAAWNSETLWAVKPLMDGVYDAHPRFLAALAAYRKHRQ